MNALMRNLGQTSISLEHRVTKAAMAGGLLFGLLVIFIVPPANLPVPACLFHSITGHSCMTCGMTRSLHAASHGEVAASFGYHLFGPGIFLGMLLYMLLFAGEAISGRSAPIYGNYVKGKNRIIAVIAGSWILYWLVRLTNEIVA